MDDFNIDNAEIVPNRKTGSADRKSIAYGGEIEACVKNWQSIAEFCQGLAVQIRPVGQNVTGDICKIPQQNAGAKGERSVSRPPWCNLRVSLSAFLRTPEFYEFINTQIRGPTAPTAGKINIA